MSQTNTQIINKICNEIYDPKSPYMDYMNKNIPPKYRDDLLQEIILILLKNPKKLIEAYNNKWLIYLFVNISSKQFFSTSSPFYKYFREQSSEQILPLPNEDDSDLEYKIKMEEKWDELQEALNKTKFTWYSETLFDYYFNKNLSYKKIEKITGVDHCSIFIEIHKCLKEIRKNISSDIISPDLSVYKNLPKNKK